MYSYDDRMRAVKLYIQYARHPASSTTNDERLTTNDKIQKSRHPKVTAVLFQYGRENHDLPWFPAPENPMGAPWAQMAVPPVQ